MKPLFSDEERSQANKNFIIARYQHRARISSYYSIVTYLDDNRIIPICSLNRSGNKIDIYKNGVYVGAKQGYSAGDACVYFEHLVAVVSGAEPASEEMIKIANDQLFQIIHILGSNIEMDKNVHLLEPYDWMNLFSDFDERLTKIKDTIDYRDKAIVDILKSVSEMIKKNVALLEVLQNEYSSVFPDEGKSQ